MSGGSGFFSTEEYEKPLLVFAMPGVPEAHILGFGTSAALRLRQTDPVTLCRLV